MGPQGELGKTKQQLSGDTLHSQDLLDLLETSVVLGPRGCEEPRARWGYPAGWETPGRLELQGCP